MPKPKKGSLLPKPMILIVLLIAGIVGYFILNSGITSSVSTPYDKVFRARPQPMAVNPIKTEVTRSDLISEKGGTLAFKDGQQDLALTIPENSLLSPEEITLKPLKNIEQLPEGSRFIAGAELSPDGLGFIKNSMLTVKLLPGTPTENLVAFVYEEGGQNFYFHPFSIDGDVVNISLDGFSGGGVIDIPGLIPIINPGTPEQTAKELLADVLRRAQRKMIAQRNRGEEGIFDPKLLEEARGILNAWYQHGVKPDLRAAERDDAKVDEAIKQMLSWRSRVHALGLDEHFQKEFEEALNSSARAVKHGVYQSSKRCINQKDPSQVSNLLRWLKLTEELGLAGRDGLTEQEVQEKAKNCVVFEIKMDSNITGPSIALKIPAKLNGILQLSDDFTHLVGNGTVNEGPSSYSTGGGGSCRDGAVTYNFTIPDTQFNINLHKKSSPKIDLTLDLSGGGQEVPFNCTGYTGPAFHVPAPWSTDYFPEFHRNELVKGTKSTYFFQKWQFVGSPGIYAQKVYKQSIEGVNENTTFILKHTPRR